MESNLKKGYLAMPENYKPPCTADGEWNQNLKIKTFLPTYSEAERRAAVCAGCKITEQCVRMALASGGKLKEKRPGKKDVLSEGLGVLEPVEFIDVESTNDRYAFGVKVAIDLTDEGKAPRAAERADHFRITSPTAS